jgi:phosphoserine phosphatase
MTGKGCSYPSAFFDFDDTIIEGDSILYWMSFYYRRRPLLRFFQVFGFLALLLYLFRLINGATLKRIFLMPMCYEDEELLDDLAGEFVRHELVNYIYPNMLERMLTHRLLNHRVVVVSASPFFYLKYVDELLPTDLIIGTRMKFPRKGWVRLRRKH